VDTRCLFYQKDLGKDLKFPETSSLDPADLLFLDPPYGQDLLMPAFLNLQKNGWLAKGCICVFECERELHIPETESRYYGDTQIIIRELE
jgi:16S rRNA (guanine966-N2)-methyltransferase